MNPGDAAKLVAVLKGAYPRQQVTADTVKTYAHFLGDIDWDLGEAAVLRHIGTNQYWPSIAEIRKAVAEMVNPLPSAEEAWEEVYQALGQPGGEVGRPTFTRPEIDRAVTAVGWRHLLLSDNLMMDRIQFVRAYEAIRGKVQEQVNLTGIAAARGLRQLGGELVKALPAKGGAG